MPNTDEKVQLSFRVAPELKQKYDVMCSMRAWSKEETLKALLDFLEDARNSKKKDVSRLLKKHGLNKVSE